MRPLPIPEQFTEHVAAFQRGDVPAVEPRNAATVVLLRPGRDEAPAEVYLMRRRRSMAFAGGMWVFPGGGVDPLDADERVAWAGPSPADWAQRLGVDESLARALLAAAVRETFEESGVLLAGPDEHSVVADTTGDDWEADRVALEARELHFADFLRRRGLVLRTDLLGVLSAWTTPAFEQRRFATWFFVAALPEGQVTRDVSTESSAVEWRTPLSACEEVESGDVAMMPPTYLTCLDVARYPTPALALAETAGRTVTMHTPEVVRDDEGRYFLTDHPEFGALAHDRTPAPF